MSIFSGESQELFIQSPTYKLSGNLLLPTVARVHDTSGLIRMALQSETGITERGDDISLRSDSDLLIKSIEGGNKVASMELNTQFEEDSSGFFAESSGDMSEIEFEHRGHQWIVYNHQAGGKLQGYYTGLISGVEKSIHNLEPSLRSIGVPQDVFIEITKFCEAAKLALIVAPKS